MKKDVAKVEYNNDLNALSFRSFQETDLNFLMAICSKMRDLGEETQYFEYETIMNLVEWDRKRTLNDFHKDLKRMSDRLRHVGATIDRDEDEFTSFNLFIEFDGSKKERKLTVRINPKFKYILNGISKNFTTFELREYVNLEGKYTKLLYQHLKQYRTTGWWTVDLDDLRHLLGIPESMPTRNISSKIINPSLELIKTCKGFADIHYEVERSTRGKGRAIKGYRFLWTAKGQMKGQEVMNIDKMDPDKKEVEKPRSHHKKKTNTVTGNFDQRQGDLNGLMGKKLAEAKQAMGITEES